jgi:hypothetical protein
VSLRVISLALKPASTSTRVLPATIKTAFPVDPLPRTVSFMLLALALNEERLEGIYHLTKKTAITRFELASQGS